MSNPINMGNDHTHSQGHASYNHDTHQGHGGHGVDHSDHEMMFRSRFWVSLILMIPVLLFSPMIQTWFGFSMPEFTGSNLIGPGFAIAIFLYGGIPFLQMAVPEIQSRKPGMMTLISLAITTSFVYTIPSPIMWRNHYESEYVYRQSELIVAKYAKLNPVRAFWEAF